MCTQQIEYHFIAKLLFVVKLLPLLIRALQIRLVSFAIFVPRIYRVDAAGDGIAVCASAPRPEM